LDVLRLPALGALGHVKLHGLAFLQAAEAASLNRGEMHENVFAILSADKAIALASLNHFTVPCSAIDSSYSCFYWIVLRRIAASEGVTLVGDTDLQLLVNQT
jgi:hypothetical protein